MDNEKLVKEYAKQEMKTVKEILERYGYEFDKKESKKHIARKVEIVEEILEKGLDIGTIIKCIVRVTLIKKKGKFFFKYENALFPVNDEISEISTYNNEDKIQMENEGIKLDCV